MRNSEVELKQKYGKINSGELILNLKKKIALRVTIIFILNQTELFVHFDCIKRNTI